MVMVRKPRAVEVFKDNQFWYMNLLRELMRKMLQQLSTAK
jgi:hypothetical protein